MNRIIVYKILLPLLIFCDRISIIIDDGISVTNINRDIGAAHRFLGLRLERVDMH